MFNIYLEYLYNEAKEALIAKMPWDDEQKKAVQELVNKYPQKASKIDWNNKALTADQALTVLREESKKDVKKQIRQGIPGLIEGTDYIEFHDIPKPNHDVRVFSPLNYKASCAIGRGAKWCTAMENNATHWRSYTKRGVTFFYIHDTFAKNMQRIAVSVERNGNISIFDKQDIQSIKASELKDLFGLTPQWFIKHVAIVQEGINKNKEQRKVSSKGKEVVFEDDPWKVIVCGDFEAFETLTDYYDESEFEERTEDGPIYLLKENDEEKASYLLHKPSLDFIDLTTPRNQKVYLGGLFYDNSDLNGVYDFLMDEWDVDTHPIDIEFSLTEVISDFYNGRGHNEVPSAVLKSILINKKNYKKMFSECSGEIKEFIEEKYRMEGIDSMSDDDLWDFVNGKINLSGVVKTLKKSMDTMFDEANENSFPGISYDVEKNRAFVYLDEEYILNYMLDDIIERGRPDTYNDLPSQMFEGYYLSDIKVDDVIKEYLEAGYETPEEYAHKLREKEYKKAGQMKLPFGRSKKKKVIAEDVNIFERYLRG